MRNMSFAMTIPQVRNRTKTVTRRLGWKFLKPGDLVRAVKKSMGLKKGETIEVLAILRVLNVWRQRLNFMHPSALLTETPPAEELKRDKNANFHKYKGQETPLPILRPRRLFG